MKSENLVKSKETVFLGGKDEVIINVASGYIDGGVVVDLEGYNQSVVVAGQPVILEDGSYKPLGFKNEENKLTYDEVSGGNLVGVIAKSKETKGAEALSVSVVTFGQVYTEAAYIPYTDEIIKAISGIKFV